MKLLLLALADASIWNQLDEHGEEFSAECFWKCTIKFGREQERCNKHEVGSPEYNQCQIDADENWRNCLKVDGCIQV